jgi:hypothetical protein
MTRPLILPTNRGSLPSGLSAVVPEPGETCCSVPGPLREFWPRPKQTQVRTTARGIRQDLGWSISVLPGYRLNDATTPSNNFREGISQLPQMAALQTITFLWLAIRIFYWMRSSPLMSDAEMQSSVPKCVFRKIPQPSALRLSSPMPRPSATKATPQT